MKWAYAVAVLCLCGCQRGSSQPSASRESGASSASVPSVRAESTALRVPVSQVYEPQVADGERRPLLIFLHGLGSSGQAAFDGLRLAELGARERVFVIAPDGSIDSRGRRFWNAHPACCDFDHRGIDDVARIAQLLELWMARHDVDPSRLYVMGHSNGGFMTQRLACALGDRIAGAASLAGAAPAAGMECTPTKALTLLEVHGDADPIVRYEGGSVFDTVFLPRFGSAQQGLSDWAKRFGCTGPANSGPDLDLDPGLPGAETRVQSFAGCPGGSVALWTVHGGTHSVGTDPESVARIWRFLSAPRK